MTEMYNKMEIANANGEIMRNIVYNLCLLLKHEASREISAKA